MAEKPIPRRRTRAASEDAPAAPEAPVAPAAAPETRPLPRVETYDQPQSALDANPGYGNRPRRRGQGQGRNAAGRGPNMGPGDNRPRVRPDASRSAGLAPQQPRRGRPGGRPAGRPGGYDNRGPGGGGYDNRGRGGGGYDNRGGGAYASPGRGPQGGPAANPRSTQGGQLPLSLIYGINPVGVALDAGLLRAIFFDMQRPTERTQHLHAQAVEHGVEVLPLARQGWSRAIPPEQHQGVAGILLDMPSSHLEEVVAEAGPDSCILVLDRVQDPQNLGAVLRTAAATGVDAVVLPKAGGCPITPAVHKASAGMSLKVRIVEDENLARALDYLKEQGYWAIGCDSEGGEDATTFEYPQRRVIVMGNEAEGMRRLVRESCDYIVRIPMAAGVESLNISVATAVVMYLAQADLAKAAEMEGAGEDS